MKADKVGRNGGVQNTKWNHKLRQQRHHCVTATAVYEWVGISYPPVAMHSCYAETHLHEGLTNALASARDVIKRQA